MNISHKNIQILGVLLGGIIFFEVHAVYGQAKNAFSQTQDTQIENNRQKNNKSQDQKSQESRKPPLVTLFDQIKKLLQRIPSPLITRGDVCPIAPGILEEENKIFNVRPVFIWYGAVDKIVLRDYKSGMILWSQEVPEGTRYWKYTGSTDLSPGESYIWELMYQGTPRSQKMVEVMTQQARNSLLQDSLTLTDNSSDPPSLARANYFSEQQLWSDKLIAIGNDISPHVSDEVEELIYSWSRQRCIGEVG